jgi:hypothetical protein
MLYGCSYGEMTAHPDSPAARTTGMNWYFMVNLGEEYNLDSAIAMPFEKPGVVATVDLT